MMAFPLFVQNSPRIGDFNEVYFYSFDVKCFDNTPIWCIFSPTLTMAEHSFGLYKSSMLKMEQVENIERIDLQDYSCKAMNYTVCP